MHTYSMYDDDGDDTVSGDEVDFSGYSESMNIFLRMQLYESKKVWWSGRMYSTSQTQLLMYFLLATRIGSVFLA